MQKNKLAIITGHAYGLFLDPDEIYNTGISKVSTFDLQYAREKDLKLKLVPSVYKVDEQTIALEVMPHFITFRKFLFNVEYEYNGVIAEAAFSNQQFFYGKGAGGHHTGSAVLSDISANSYGYRYDYKKLFQHNETSYTRDVDCEVYVRYNNEADLEKMGLRSVTELFRGKDCNYSIGTTNLDTLFKNCVTLHNLNLFIVRTPGKGV